MEFACVVSGTFGKALGSFKALRFCKLAYKETCLFFGTLWTDSYLFFLKGGSPLGRFHYLYDGRNHGKRELGSPVFLCSIL